MDEMILMGNGEDDCRIDHHEDECKFVKNADRETYAYRKTHWYGRAKRNDKGRKYADKNERRYRGNGA